MGGIKRTVGDEAFSNVIRERSHWTCDRCHKVYPDGQAKGNSAALHASHYIGRGNWNIRFTGDNCSCHCYGCHSLYGGDSELQRRTFLDVYGEGRHDILMEKKNDNSRGYRAHREIKAIAKHYRLELKKMREQRAGGAQGRIEFIDYD